MYSRLSDVESSSLTGTNYRMIYTRRDIFSLLTNCTWYCWLCSFSEIQDSIKYQKLPEQPKWYNVGFWKLRENSTRPMFVCLYKFTTFEIYHTCNTYLYIKIVPGHSRTWLIFYLHCYINMYAYHCQINNTKHKYSTCRHTTLPLLDTK